MSYACLAGCIAGSGKFFPLDIVPGAAAAYSIRRLSNTYTGSAINVRRSSDNAVQDIGFSSAVLDSASLLSFCGAGSGYSATFYDQSGNTLNGSQATAASQPRIVNSGVVDNALIYDGGESIDVTDNALIDFNSTMTLLFVGTLADFNSVRTILDKRTSGGNYPGYTVFTASTDGHVFMQWNNAASGRSADFGLAPGAGVRFVMAITATKDASATCKINNVAASANFSGSGTGTSVNNQPLKIGGHTDIPAFQWVGGIDELILYNSIISDAQRDAYIANARQFYGIS